MDVSIIIVNYNTKELLKACIESIYKQRMAVSYEIIVVDNDSKDGSGQMVKDFFQEVILVQSKENLGFGRANNLGVRYASGDFLFFLNSDTLFLNNALDFFVEFYKNNKFKIGALGAILSDSEKNYCHSYGPFITPKLLIKDIISKYTNVIGKVSNAQNAYLHPSEVTSTYIRVDYITGADLFVPKGVVKEIGVFDPIFFMYCEEVDWQKRMDMSGYERLIIPGPEIVHLEGASAPSKTKHRSLGRVYNIFKSQMMYINKYNPYYIYLLFRVVFAILWIPAILARKDSISEKLNVIKLLLSPICA